jgi:hypothetical protein
LSDGGVWRLAFGVRGSGFGVATPDERELIPTGGDFRLHGCRFSSTLHPGNWN